MSVQRSTMCYIIRIYSRSWIHERTISLGFLGIILKVLRLGVSVKNVDITNQSQTTFAQGEEWESNLLAEVTLNSKEENSEDLCPNYVQDSASVMTPHNACQKQLVCDTIKMTPIYSKSMVDLCAYFFAFRNLSWEKTPSQSWLIQTLSLWEPRWIWET